MKKLFIPLFVAAAMLTSANTMAFDKKEKVEISEKDQKRIVEISNRVEEIRKMNKSNLSFSERKALKTELKQIKNEANKLGGGGIYISATAILIIILLIIIL